jgi:hypothetical protein
LSLSNVFRVPRFSALYDGWVFLRAIITVLITPFGSGMRNRSKPTKFNCFSQIAVVILLALVAIPVARAQPSGFDVAGADLAQAILHKKLHSVAVVDFSGPGQRVSILGERLADQVSAAVARAGGGLHVEDRSQVAEARKQGSYAAEIVLDPASVALFGRELNVDVIVTGNLQDEQDGTLALFLKAFQMFDGKGIAAVRVTIQPTPEMKSLMGQSADPPLGAVADFVDDGTSLIKTGFKAPHCIRCSFAPSEDAMNHMVDDTIELTAVVGTNGSATDILVRKGLPEGLTVESIRALKTWRFTPATDPAGKPITARMLIVMKVRVSSD